MLFVIDKPQFQRVIAIVRDDRRKEDQGLAGPDGLEILPAKYLANHTKLEIEVTAEKGDGYDFHLEMEQ